jgi:ATP-binding cassette subfamily C (CFTR/MRP) protein 1
VRFTSAWTKEQSAAAKKGREPSILRALFTFSGAWTLGIGWGLTLLTLVLQLLPPLVSKVAIQFVGGEINLTVLQQALLVVTMAAVMIGNAIFLSIQQHMMRQLGIQIKTALTIAIFQKSLRITSSGRRGQSTGQIATLMSADAMNFEQLMDQVPTVIFAPVMIVICFVLIYREIGSAMYSAIVFMLALLPINVLIFSRLILFTKNIMTATEKRVKLVNDVVAGIRAIKTCSWEGAFEKKIDVLREEELHWVARHAYWYAVGMNTVFVSAPQMLTLTVYATLYLMGGAFTPSAIWTSAMLFGVIQHPFGMIPAALASLVQGIVSAGRIRAFLLAPEHQELGLLKEGLSTQGLGEQKEAPPSICIHKASFTWGEEAETEPAKGGGKKEKEIAKRAAPLALEGAGDALEGAGDALEGAAGDALEGAAGDALEGAEPALGNVAAGDADQKLSNNSGPFHLDSIDLTVTSNQLVAVVGSVGSGKTSLLMAMVREMEQAEGCTGTVEIKGQVAYAGQVPFIMNATLKDNILMGRPLDEEAYKDVLRASALLPDLEALEDGDMTEIGERGITLSGGQKARVSIARACYCSYFGTGVYLLDDPLAAVDSHVGAHLFEHVISSKGGLLRQKLRVLVTNQLQYLQFADTIVMMVGGKIAEQGSYAELVANNGAFTALVSEIGYSTDEENDQKGGAAVDAQDPAKGGAVPKEAPKVGSSEAQELMQVEDQEERGMKLNVLLYYMQSGGLTLTSIAFFFTGMQVYWNLGNQFVLALWTDATLQAQRQFTELAPSSNKNYMLWFAFFSCANIATIIFGAVLVATSRIRAARRLHRGAVSAVLEAPTSFFDTTPIGRILNRFSSDVSAVDLLLMIMLGWCIFAWNMLLQFCLALAIATKGVALIVLAPVCGSFLEILSLIRSPMTEVKRMEATTRSPVYASFSETLVGLVTIRAYGFQEQFIDTMQTKIDSNTRPSLTSRYIAVWLALRLGIMGAVLLSSVVLFAMVFSNFMTSGILGVALANGVMIPIMMQHTINLTAMTEVQLNSVERLRHYVQRLPRERYEAIEDDPRVPSASADKTNGKAVEDGERMRSEAWPSEGRIVFEKVRCRYRDGPLVLKGISFATCPAEKIGVVGRTGSGKSTLASLLFRLIEVEDGTISIDGVKLERTHLRTLRAGIGHIPQDPVLFGSSVRFNLDPFDEYTDDAIWDALEKAQLKGYIETLTGQLSYTVEEGGTNFSQGQRQLLCISRTLLQRPKVLVMDEATASVDEETDKLLQTMIRSCFKECTVLTIAHRLNTIADSDRVLVLNDGNLVEFDSPAALLQKPLTPVDGEDGEDGTTAGFRAMVDATGAASADLIRKTAAQAAQVAAAAAAAR